MVVMKTQFKPRKNFNKNNYKGKIKNNNYNNDEFEEHENNENENVIEIPKDTLIVLQELKIARVLGGNDAAKRQKQVRNLRRWLPLRAESSFPMLDENFMRLWKGLYYCMYMSDKPLVQEQLAENLGKLVECFAGHADLSVKFFSAYLNTMRNEWFGIDQWRMDKFYMLMRRMLRHMLCVLKSVNWRTDIIKLFNEETKRTVLAESGCAMAMTMHYMDIIFEELAKVSQGDISAEQVSLFLEPFIDYLITQNDSKLFTHCRGRIFNHMLFQSKLGRAYQEKYEAWKLMGFPETIDDVEMIETEEETEKQNEINAADDDDKNNNKLPLDPRAGNVDVYVPELPLDGTTIVERLREVILKEEMSTKRRKMLKTILTNYETYQAGEFPLGVKTMPRFKDERETDLPLVEEKVAALEETEEELYSTTRKLKKLNKRQRRKLLKTINFQNIKAEEFYDVIEKALPKANKQERLKQLRKSLMTGWIEEDVDDIAENLMKKKTKESSLKKKEKFKLHLEKVKARKQKLREEKAKKSIVEVVVENQQEEHVENKELQTATLNKIPKLMQVKKVNEEIVKPIANTNGTWQEPLAEGEVEYFIPSRRLMVKKRNEQMVRTLAMDNQLKVGNSFTSASSPRTPASAKRVKIALKNNTIQKPSDYIKQIKSSPNVPYDSSKKPGKGLLKPHSMPSPVDPFYARRNSLKLRNTSF